MIQAYVKMWKNFANFKGRASRADYWWAYLANLIVSFVIGLVAGIVKLPILTTKNSHRHDIFTVTSIT